MWLSKLFAKDNRGQQARQLRAVKFLRILTVSVPTEDVILLEYWGNQHGWEFTSTRSPEEAFRLACHVRFDMILCNRNQPGFPWREVMGRLAASSPESCILLVAPTKDDYLWWDVLTHGGFDVLVRPLRRETVLCSISAAARCQSAVSICSNGAEALV